MKKKPDEDEENIVLEFIRCDDTISTESSSNKQGESRGILHTGLSSPRQRQDRYGN